MSERESALSKAARWLSPAALLGLAIGAFVLLGEREQKKREEAGSAGPPVVQAAQVVEHLGPIEIRADGVAVPFREIELAAEVSGVIASKSPSCETGAYVRRGELLLMIDPRDYELEVRRLESVVAQSDSDLAELEQERANTVELLAIASRDVELQGRELDRLKSLIGRGVVTESEVDRAEAAVLTSRNAKVNLENQIALLNKRNVRLESAKKLAESQLEKAQLDVARTSITAPVDGVVVRETAEAGSFVQRGAPLAVIEDTSRVEVKCHLEMGELYWIWAENRTDSASLAPPPISNEDAEDSSTSAADAEWLAVAGRYRLPPVEATIDYRMAGRDDVVYRWRGRLSRFDGIGMNEQTRTAPVLIEVSEPLAMTVIRRSDQQVVTTTSGPRALMRGMFVGVSIFVHPEARVVRIPDGALRPGGRVLRIRDGRLNILKNMHVIRRVVPAETAPQDDGAAPAEPESGDPYWLVAADVQMLGPDDHVAVGPLMRVQEGMEVLPQTEREALSPSAAAPVAP